MKCVIEKGFVSAIKDVKWKTETAEGVKHILCVKERTGDDEFSSVIVHELTVKDEDYKEVKTYEGKTVRVEGHIYARYVKNKEKNTDYTFSNFVLESIELV